MINHGALADSTFHNNLRTLFADMMEVCVRVQYRCLWHMQLLKDSPIIESFPCARRVAFDTVFYVAIACTCGGRCPPGRYPCC